MKFEKLKLKCPICKNLYDSSLHIPKILIYCGHTICSLCISAKIHENLKNEIICPYDSLVNNKITSVDLLPTNKSLLDLIENIDSNNKNKNLEINIEDMNFPLDVNTPKSTSSISSDYLRKSNTIRTSLKNIPSNICLKHSLPLNVICIDEKKKICSQCALQSNHFNHQIVTDEEFMNQIDNLIDLFQEIDNNSQKYLNKENISSSFILDELNKKFTLIKENIDKKTKSLIENIVLQKNIILTFLEERRNEIIKKYNSASYDIKQLIEQTNKWMSLVQNKWEILNDIKDPIIECIKLIDDDSNKNQIKLIQAGKQLNDRFNFINQTENIIKNLEEFKNNGIIVELNEKLINRIIIKKPIEHKIIKNNIFIIYENNDLVNKLNLQNYIFENSSKNNQHELNKISNISNENIDEYNNLELKQYKLINRESDLSTERIINDLNEIEENRSSKSLVNELFDNFKNTKKKNSLLNISQNETNISKDSKEYISKKNETSFNISNINLSTDNSKIKLKKKISNYSPLTQKLSSTPEKDKKVFIKTQLKNNIANFNRIDIGDDGVQFICHYFKSNQGSKYKELKFVKSNLTNENVNSLIDAIKNYNIQIQNINFSNNGLNDKCGNYIIDLLKNYSFLKIFYLSNNSFSTKMKEKIKSYSRNNNMGCVKIFI